MYYYSSFCLLTAVPGTINSIPSAFIAALKDLSDVTTSKGSIGVEYIIAVAAINGGTSFMHYSDLDAMMYAMGDDSDDFQIPPE